MMVMVLIKLLIFLHLLLTTEVRGKNVAIGKNVTMSSEFGATFKGKYAVDGKLPNSSYGSGICYCCAGTGKQPDPWLRVDLGAVFWVFHVVVIGREGTAETFDNMEIYLHKLESSKGDFQNKTTRSPTRFNVSFTPYVEARYLTLIQRGYLLTVYCEVEVYGVCYTRTFGHDCSGVCHCESNNSCDPESGKCPYDLCAPGWHGHTCSEKCPVGWYGEGCNNQCGHCVTTDDCDHVVGNCTECGPGYKGQFCNTECEFGKYGLNCSDTCHCLNNSLCSHVDGSCLDDRCAFGWMGPNCSLYSNVAFGKTVELSSNIPFAGLNAENAVDDVIPDVTNVHVCDCCTSTDTQHDPWLRVDFGTVYMIFTVIIHGRQDSDESLKQTNIYLQTLKNDLSQAIDTILNDVTVYNKTFNHPVPAQYITLVQRGHKALIVCELEAYSGNCRTGTYGFLCDNMCHCDRPSCNTKTGECFSGNCLPGYQSNKCDQVCPEGTFGQNCSRSCGNCLARAPCDHVTGSCLACASSFKGKLCKEDNFMKILTYSGSGFCGLVILIVAIVCICRKCRAKSNQTNLLYVR